MFDGLAFGAPANCVAPAITAPFKIGDRVLVLFGDTPILGTIESTYTPADGDEDGWNVRTDASGRPYPIHETFLRQVRAPSS